VPAPKHRLKAGGISERAMAARVAQAWEPKPARIWTPSQAGHLDDAPPHDFIPDGPGEAARALNRRLHPMNDELPGDLGPPKLDCTERDRVPRFLDRRKPNGSANDAGRGDVRRSGDGGRSMTRVTLDLLDAEAMGLAQMCKRFTYEDAVRFSNRYDGGRERDAILDGISTLQKALAEAGFAPR
jgi:hypothetical protein